MMLAGANTLVLLVILTMSLFSGALLLFWTWLSNRNEALPLFGAAAYVVLGCGVGLIGARQFVPEPLSIIGGNLGLIGGASLLYGGLCRFNGRPFPTVFVASLPLVFLAMLAIPTVYSFAPLRFSVSALLVAIAYGMSAVEVLRPRDGLRSRVPLAFAVALQSVMALGRAPLTIFADPPIFTYSGPWFAAIVMEAVVFAQVVSYLVISLPKERVEQALQRAAHSDSLTGLQNRRAFHDSAAHVLSLAARHGHPTALVSFDLDHFKQLNDTYGHAAGDEALKAFARVLASSLRTSDICARLGGEEFVALLCETTAADAHLAAERVVVLFAAQKIEVGGRSLRATVSAGVSGCPDGRSSLEEMLIAADHALYAAKQAGRNRVGGGGAVVPQAIAV